MALESGQVIAGKYRLDQQLGQGGMASVWSATNVFTDRQFAIKFLLESVSKSPEASRRFMLEGKISGKIHHDNVIQIIDVGQSETGMLFLVMELLNGVPLETAMRRQQPPMTVYEFVGVMLDVARGLLAAHRASVVHRDLKPSNIFLHRDRDGVAVPKILDFGVSKFLLDGERDNALTVAGTVLGSPLYMSPEQAMGVTDIDQRTDIFAYGAILFEGLCGFRAYDAPNFNALIVMIATQQPKRVDEYAPQMPEGLRAVVRDCLVTERAARIQSFEQIIERLNVLLPELEPSPLRLPLPLGSNAVIDPEETGAMPALVRPSDRPPSLYPAEDPRNASPASGFAAPHLGATHSSKGPPIMLFVGIGVALASMFIVVVILAVVARGRATVAATPTVAPSVVAPPPTASALELPADAPVISVDSLPSATSGTAKPKGNGKLWISAGPGWCNVIVDGRPQGATPLTDIELPPGAHDVRCTGPSGKTASMVVTIYPGGTTKHKFTVAP